MNIQPLDYFDPEDLCKFEMFGLSNATMVPVMITMTPGPILSGNGDGNGNLIDGQQQQQQQQHAYIQPLQQINQQFYTIQSASPHQQQNSQSPITQTTMTILQPTQIPLNAVKNLPPGSIIVPTQTQITTDQLQQQQHHFDIASTGNENIIGTTIIDNNCISSNSYDGISGGGGILYQQQQQQQHHKNPIIINNSCPRHHNLLSSNIQTKSQADKFYEAFNTNSSSATTTSNTNNSNTNSIIVGSKLMNSSSVGGNTVSTINEEEEEDDDEDDDDDDSGQMNEETSTSCIPGFNGSSSNNSNGIGIGNVVRNNVFGGPEGCSVGCNALMIMGIGGNNNGYNNRNGNNRRQQQRQNRIQHDNFINNQQHDDGLLYNSGQDNLNDNHHIKQQQLPCNCTYMSFDNFGDYQTTGFGGLPDVTEHSNIKRTTSHQDSIISNSESAIEISSLQKSTKKSLKSNRSSSIISSTTTQASSTSIRTKKIYKNNFCILSFMSLIGLILCAGIATFIVYQLVFMAPSRNSHDERIKIVRKILNEIPLVDGHNDLAWNVRKYAHSSLELLDLNNNHNNMDHKTVWHRPAWSQTDITRLKEGLVGAQIWSAYVPCDAQGLDAVQLALEQIDIIHRFTELHSTETTLVISSQEIIQAHSKGLIASLIGIEGGHALGSSLGVLRSFHSLGARYLTLTHQCDTTWAGSSSMTMDKGLTGFGKSVIKEMNRLGMLIDLTHSSDVTAKDVLDVTRAPVIFSHSLARALCNSTRNIPDDILRSVADNGGLIMISFDSEYITCSESSTLHDVIAHIKYIRSIAGIEHIGIGAGYDGIERPPIGLEDVSKYPNLFATLLEDTSWTEEDLAKLAGKNFIRVLKSVENVRDYWKRAAIQPVETSEPIKKSQCTYMSS